MKIGGFAAMWVKRTETYHAVDNLKEGGGSLVMRRSLPEIKHH